VFQGDHQIHGDTPDDEDRSTSTLVLRVFFERAFYLFGSAGWLRWDFLSALFLSSFSTALFNLLYYSSLLFVVEENIS
jgi:hypothetical protein